MTANTPRDAFRRHRKRNCETIASHSKPERDLMERLLRRAFVVLRNYLNCVRLLGVPGWRVVLESLLGQRHEVTVQVQGQPLILRLNTTDLETLLQMFWNREYEFDLAREPDVIVDAGANVGYASVFFALRYPNARIFAIEPEAANFRQLQKNAASCSRIVPVEAALWCEDAQLALVDVGEGSWGFRVSTRPEHGDTISGVSLETLMQRHDLKTIDVLKVDIEGSEKELFEHSQPWIDSVGVIVAELHDKYRPGCSRAFYNATNGFSTETRLGENVLLLRDAYAQPQ